MKTIALRFGETFAPECGTIAAHQSVIDEIGFVWYGKLGTTVSSKIIEEMKQNDDPKFLLSKSRDFRRYWIHFTEVSTSKPKNGEFPSYYGKNADRMNTWFKVNRIELAPRNVMSHCYVLSSGNLLSYVSKYSMSPYFIIDYREDE